MNNSAYFEKETGFGGVAKENFGIIYRVFTL